LAIYSRQRTRRGRGWVRQKLHAVCFIDNALEAFSARIRNEYFWAAAIWGATGAAGGPLDCCRLDTGVNARMATAMTKETVTAFKIALPWEMNSRSKRRCFSPAKFARIVPCLRVPRGDGARESARLTRPC